MNLNELKYLKEGWDGYQAPSPEDKAINRARNVIEIFELFKPLSVAPCADGGVTLHYGNNVKTLLIECFNSGEITFCLTESGKTKMLGEMEPTISPTEMYKVLQPLWIELAKPNH